MFKLNNWQIEQLTNWQIDKLGHVHQFHIEKLHNIVNNEKNLLIFKQLHFCSNSKLKNSKHLKTGSTRFYLHHTIPQWPLQSTMPDTALWPLHVLQSAAQILPRLSEKCTGISRECPRNRSCRRSKPNSTSPVPRASPHSQPESALRAPWRLFCHPAAGTPRRTDSAGSYEETYG